MSGEDSFYTVDEIKGRQSISTLVFMNYRPIAESSLGELARHGINRIELLESPEQFDMTDERSMRYVGEACRTTGIEIGAYHAHKTTFSDLTTEAERTARVDQCRRQIDTLLGLGGNIWGSHARAADSTLLKCYGELARHVEGTGAVITVENFGTEGTSVEDRIRFLNELDHPQAGMILDIGHVRDGDGVNPMTVPGGPTRVLGICGGHLRHVHLHGFKDGKDHHPPLVEGDGIQWVELFRMLRAVEYRDHINFEPSGEPMHQNTLESVSLAPERIVEMAARAR